MARRLARQEEPFAGTSSGTNVVAAAPVLTEGGLAEVFRTPADPISRFEDLEVDDFSLRGRRVMLRCGW